MLKRLFDPLIPRASVIRRVTVREPLLHASAITGITAIMLYAGFGPLAWMVGGVMALAEIASRVLARLLDRPASKVTACNIFIVWVSSVVSATTYTVPGVLLAGEPSVALTLAGMLWLFGVLANITNTYARFPVFSIGMSLPYVIAMGVGLRASSQVVHVGSTTGEWVIATLLVGLYIFTNAQSAQQHAAIDRALAQARRDAAERMRRLEELHRRDPLTNLLNRTAFDEELARLLLQRHSNDGALAVVMIDLDSFKPINDTYSHEAGDQVLLTTSRRLTALLEDRGIIARLGGDEFICALTGLTTTEAAADLGKTIARAIADPIPWRDRQLRINASIGIATTDSVQVPSVSSMCAAADQAMFRAKSSPNVKPVIYDPSAFAPAMSARERQRLTDALQNGQIRPYYQPKVYLPTGEIIGFEALARWDHPERGVLSPAAFLPQIEEMGLQGQFLSRMARQVTHDIAGLLADGIDPGQVSINVPEVALATHTGRQEITQIVTENAQVRGHLTFEITEDVFIARAAEAIQASIATFRNLGIRISLDDFGTGFASFHHLRQLDFDELKIDTSFVAGLGRDPTTEVLVQGFLSIASGLGVSVIAEGVETETQRRDLLNLGCISAQGYLFSPAVPLAQARAMLLHPPRDPDLKLPASARAEAGPPLAGPGAQGAP